MRKIKLFLFFISFFLIEELIFYLFPLTTLAGIICYPLTLIIASIATYFIYLITKDEKSTKYKYWTACLVLLLGTFLQFSFHPQEEESPTEQLKKYYRAYSNYQKIPYNAFDKLTKQERVCFIYKFKNINISHISTFSVCDSSKDSDCISYPIICRPDSSMEYMSSCIMMNKDDSTTEVIEVKKNKTHKFNSFFVEFFSQDGIGFDSKDKTCTYFIDKDVLDLQTGMEKLFYFVLYLTKDKITEQDRHKYTYFDGDIHW